MDNTSQLTENIEEIVVKTIGDAVTKMMNPMEERILKSVYEIQRNFDIWKRESEYAQRDLRQELKENIQQMSRAIDAWKTASEFAQQDLRRELKNEIQEMSGALNTWKTASESAQQDLRRELKNDIEQMGRNVEEWKLTLHSAHEAVGGPYYGPSRTANTMNLTNVHEPYNSWRKERPYRR